MEDNAQYYFRGIFMSLFIDLEFVLVNLLCSLLVTDGKDKMTLQEFITPEILLRPKIKKIQTIIKKKHPLIHSKYQSDLNDLGELTDLRNSFAHQRIEVDVKKEILYFITVSNGKSQKNPFTYEVLNQKFEKLKTIMTNISKIEDEIGK